MMVFQSTFSIWLPFSCFLIFPASVIFKIGYPFILLHIYVLQAASAAEVKNTIIWKTTPFLLKGKHYFLLSHITVLTSQVL